MVRKTIILGSGCAGSTAAVYASRANLEPLVLEGHEPGGQLSLTTLVENFPGFPEGVIGPELVENIKKQALRFGSEYLMERAVSVDLEKRPFKVCTDENEFETESIIVASGASARLIGLEAERLLIGRGVSTCATCDGYFFRGQNVVVVGGGDTAMEDSLFLTKHAKKVTIIHRRDELRASRIMAERALNNPKIEVIWDTIVTDVLDVEKGGVEAVRLKNVKSGEETVFATNGLFVAIGHQPNTDIFKDKLDMDENGYLIVDNHSRTNVEGVFAAGDVHDHVYRQAITAAGAGCKAAIECERYLQEKGIE